MIYLKVMLDCNRCKKALDIKCFSKRPNGIYYYSCDKCRQTTLDWLSENGKTRQEQLDKKKQNIQCECGKSYVFYKESHIQQHRNTKYHKTFLLNKK